MVVRSDGLTDDEGRVADALFAATQAFLELPVQHPYEPDEFLAHVHRAQDMLATRIARRMFPEGWPTYEEDSPQGQQAEEAEVQGG